MSFTYKDIDNDNVMITAYTGNEKHIIIPTEHNGKTVTDISGFVFYGNNDIITISGESIQTIHDGYEDNIFPMGTFLRCYNLQSVYFPNIEYIGFQAFRDCSGLTVFSNIDLEELITIGRVAFYNTSLTTFCNGNLPELRTIEEGAFYSSRLSTFCSGNMPKLNTIHIEAFKDCSKLTSFCTTNLVELLIIRPEAFYNCSNLITFCSGNMSKLKTIEDEAFQYCSNLITFCGGKLTHLDTINEYAFYECSKLEMFHHESIPNITKIMKSSFENCAKMTKFCNENIPNLILIGDYAFKSCGDLEKICDQDLENLIGIGKEAFGSCTKLTFNGYLPNLQFIGENVFINTDFSLKGFIPHISVDTPNYTKNQNNFDANGSILYDDISGIAQNLLTDNYIFNISDNLIVNDQKTQDKFINLSDDIEYGKLIKSTIKHFSRHSNIFNIVKGFTIDTNYNQYVFNDNRAENTHFYVPLYTETEYDVYNITNTLGIYITHGTIYETNSSGIILNDISFNILKDGKTLFNIYNNTISGENIYKTLDFGITETIENYWMQGGSVSIIPERLFEFEDIDETRVIITKYNGIGVSHIIIPIERNGKTVTDISHNVFRNNNDIITVSGESIQNIHNFVFFGCTSLVSVYFPNIKNIHYVSFAQCSELQTFGDGIYNKLLHIGKSAFDSCYKLKFKIERGNLLKYIGESAFHNCREISVFSSASLSNLQYIGEQAFLLCINLNKFCEDTVPNLVSIGDSAFANCSVFTTFSNDNHFYPYLHNIGLNTFRGSINFRIVGFLPHISRNNLETNKNLDQIDASGSILYDDISGIVQDTINNEYIFNISNDRIVNNKKVIYKFADLIPTIGYDKLIRGTIKTIAQYANKFQIHNGFTINTKYNQHIFNDDKAKDSRFYVPLNTETEYNAFEITYTSGIYITHGTYFNLNEETDNVITENTKFKILNDNKDTQYTIYNNTISGEDVYETLDTGITRQIGNFFMYGGSVSIIKSEISIDEGNVIFLGYFFEHFQSVFHIDYENKIIRLKQDIEFTCRCSDYIRITGPWIFDGDNHKIEFTADSKVCGILRFNGDKVVKVKNLQFGVSGTTMNGILDVVNMSDHHGHSYLFQYTEKLYVNIENCSNHYSIDQPNSGGLIFGTSLGNSISNTSLDQNIEMKNCFNSGNISGKDSGGLCGSGIGARNKCILMNCYNTGDISNNESGGGLCGGYSGCNGQVIIMNCFNEGNMINDCEAVGGICGFNAGRLGLCVLINCYNTGNIEDNYESGGLCGSNAGYEGKCFLFNCYNNGNITNSRYAGGIVGLAGGNDGILGIVNTYFCGTNHGTNENIGGLFGLETGIEYGSVILYNTYSTISAGSLNNYANIYKYHTYDDVVIDDLQEEWLNNNYEHETGPSGEYIKTEINKVLLPLRNTCKYSKLKVFEHINTNIFLQSLYGSLQLPLLQSFLYSPWNGYTTYTSTPTLNLYKTHTTNTTDCTIFIYFDNIIKINKYINYSGYSNVLIEVYDLQMNHKYNIEDIRSYPSLLSAEIKFVTVNHYITFICTQINSDPDYSQLVALYYSPTSKKIIKFKKGWIFKIDNLLRYTYVTNSSTSIIHRIEDQQFFKDNYNRLWINDYDVNNKILYNHNIVIDHNIQFTTEDDIFGMPSCMSENQLILCVSMNSDDELSDTKRSNFIIIFKRNTISDEFKVYAHLKSDGRHAYGKYMSISKDNNLLSIKFDHNNKYFLVFFNLNTDVSNYKGTYDINKITVNETTGHTKLSSDDDHFGNNVYMPDKSTIFTADSLKVYKYIYNNSSDEYEPFLIYEYSDGITHWYMTPQNKIILIDENNDKIKIFVDVYEPDFLFTGLFYTFYQNGYFTIENERNEIQLHANIALTGDISNSFIYIPDNWTFNGNKNKIKLSNTLNCNGLFRKDETSNYITIQNVGVEGSSTQLQNSGFFFPSATSYVFIRNCYNHCHISSSESENCGGFMGYNTSHTIISNSYNAGNIVTTFSGGFIASTNNSGHVVIRNSYNHGEIQGENCAGFCAKIVDRDNDPNIKFYNCYNTGNITKANSSAFFRMNYDDFNSYVNFIVFENIYNIGTIPQQSYYDEITNQESEYSNCYGRTIINNLPTNIQDISKIYDKNDYTDKFTQYHKYVDDGSTYEYPILKAFQQYPWKKTSYSHYKDKASFTSDYMDTPIDTEADSEENKYILCLYYNDGTEKRLFTNILCGSDIPLNQYTKKDNGEPVLHPPESYNYICGIATNHDAIIDIPKQSYPSNSNTSSLQIFLKANTKFEFDADPCNLTDNMLYTILNPLRDIRIKPIHSICKKEHKYSSYLFVRRLNSYTSLRPHSFEFNFVLQKFTNSSKIPAMYSENQIRNYIDDTLVNNAYDFVTLQ